MTEFKTCVCCEENRYILTFETTERVNYEYMEQCARDCIDGKITSQQLSKNERGTECHV